MNIQKPIYATILSSIALCHSALGLNLQQQNFHNVDFVVVEVSEKDDLSLFWKQPESNLPYQSFSNLIKTLAKKDTEVLFSIHSGIFGEDKAPLGWHVENGEKLQALNQVTRKNATGNFSLIPNGVFLVDQSGKRYVIETEEFLKTQQLYKTQYGTQSGPMLLINGKMHPKFYPTSDSVKYRSGVCVSNDMTYFVTTQSPINFYYFAKFFQTNLGCQNALYLDGTLSQIYYQGKIFGAPFWNARPYVGMWAVTKPSLSETSN